MAIKERPSKARSAKVERCFASGKAGAWVVTSGHERRTVFVSQESSRRIKEAAQRFDGALKRLADR